jgi:hypothetical protein
MDPKLTDLERIGEEKGYTLALEPDASSSDIVDVSGLKLAEDGKTVLIPQPSDDPNDPLNWSRARKLTILLVVTCTSFLPGAFKSPSPIHYAYRNAVDFGSAAGAVTLIQQAALWGYTPDTINHSQAGNVFMIGAGSLFGTCLCARNF